MLLLQSKNHHHFQLIVRKRKREHQVKRIWRKVNHYFAKDIQFKSYHATQRWMSACVVGMGTLKLKAFIPSTLFEKIEVKKVGRESIHRDDAICPRDKNPPDLIRKKTRQNPAQNINAEKIVCRIVNKNDEMKEWPQIKALCLVCFVWTFQKAISCSFSLSFSFTSSLNVASS